MKKHTLNLIIVMMTALLFNQCNTVMDISLTSISAEGSYDSATNETMVKIKVKIQNNTIILGRIFDWQFICYDEEGNILLQIYQENYRHLFCNAIKCDNAQFLAGSLELILETVKPKIGDVFEGKTPRYIEAWLAVEDENDNYTELRPVTDFIFTRK